MNLFQLLLIVFICPALGVYFRRLENRKRWPIGSGLVVAILMYGTLLALSNHFD
jgi:hypothetical protein